MRVKMRACRFQRRGAVSPELGIIFTKGNSNDHTLEVGALVDAEGEVVNRRYEIIDYLNERFVLSVNALLIL